MKNSILRFLLRWFVAGLSLWIAAGLIGESRISYQDSWYVIIIAGLVLTLVNMLIKPIVVILSLPAILFSLGLFMIVINAAMVLLVSWLYSPLEIRNFSGALLAGIVIGLVNYLVTTIVDTDDI